MSWAHTSPYAYIYVYIYVYMYIYTYVYIYLSIYIFNVVGSHEPVRIDICIFMYVYICVCTFMYIYIYICIYVSPARMRHATRLILFYFLDVCYGRSRSCGHLVLQRRQALSRHC